MTVSTTTSERTPAGGGTAPPRTEASFGGEGWRKTFASLENPSFRLLWLSMIASFLGLHMSFLAQADLTYQLEGNAKAVAFTVIAWGVPQAVFSLIGGVVADRIHKRTIMIVSQSAVGVAMLVMAVLIQTGRIELWQIIVVGLVQGTVFAFNVPARQAWIPEIVGRDRLTNAIALHSAAFNAMSTVGPALAGILIGISFIGHTGAYYVMAGCFAVTVLLLLRMPPEGAEPRKTKDSAVAQMVEGVRYVRGHEVLLSVLMMGFVLIVLGMPYRTLLPVFSEDIYDVGSVGFGLMSAAIGIGAVIGSLAIAYLSDYPKKNQLLVGLGTLFCVALAFFAATPWFVVGLVALGFVGLLSMGYVSLNNTLVLSNADPAFYGRVQSVYMLSWSVQPFVALPVAALADASSAQTAVMVTAAVTLAALWATMLLMPGYRRLSERPAVAAPAR
jgi:MFS family permease